MHAQRFFTSLTVGLMLTVAIFFMLGADSAMAKTVELRLAHSEAVANIRHDVTIFFAKRVDEISKGEVKIEIFPPKIVCRPAPKVPITERERTTTPRTTPRLRRIVHPGSSKAVVVISCGKSNV